MHRLVLVVSLFSLVCGSVVAEEKRPPNILFLLSDDQRPDTIAALGNDVIQTPNLDKLVERGLTFTRAICAHPLCVPSRAEILTGTTGFTNGIMPGHSSRLREGLAFWPETMKQAGYRTWYVGKWHTQGRPSTHGYDESLGLYAGGMGSKTPRRTDSKGRPVTGYHGWVFQTDDRKFDLSKGVGLTAEISKHFADATIEFLERKSKKPFFLHVNFTAPHDPLVVPKKYANTYDPKKMSLPKNFRTKHPFDHGNIAGRDEMLIPIPRTKKDVREELADYYAVITDLDEQIGRIVKTLEATGQIENTIVIFASDHGLAIGSHGLRGKQNMYEHTINVPLIFAGPGVPENQRCNAQVYLRDLFPTACDLAGIAIPKGVEGKSLVPLLRDPSKSIYRAGFGYFKDVQRMIRTDEWKLVWYPKIERYQLFHLSEDPLELTDLSGDPKYAKVQRDLVARLRTWQKTVGDPLVEN